MEMIAMDCHKRYTFVSVQTPDGRLIREQRIEITDGAASVFWRSGPAGFDRFAGRDRSGRMPGLHADLLTLTSGCAGWARAAIEP